MKRVDREHYDGTKDWKNYYWYYYKAHILAVIGLILTITICVSQCVSKVEPDYYVLFYSDMYIIDQALDDITNDFESVSEDVNGDGEVHVQAINCSYSKHDSMAASKANQMAVMQIQSSDACLWILDDAGVEQFSKKSDLDLFTEVDSDDYFVDASLLEKSNSFNNLLKQSEKDFYIYVRKSSDNKSVGFSNNILTKFLEKYSSK